MKPQAPSHLGEHAGIHPIGPGQHADGSGEFTVLTRIDLNKGDDRLRYWLDKRGIETVIPGRASRDFAHASLRDPLQACWKRRRTARGVIYQYVHMRTIFILINDRRTDICALCCYPHRRISNLACAEYAIRLGMR